MHNNINYYLIFIVSEYILKDNFLFRNILNTVFFFLWKKGTVKLVGVWSSFAIGNDKTGKYVSAQGVCKDWLKSLDFCGRENVACLVIRFDRYQCSL